MSESSAHAQTPLPGAAPFAQGAREYQLSDDLARLCLPQEFKDSYRLLAWVNSICALFLLVGLVGLKPPKVIHKPLSDLVETIPVEFTPPEELPKTEPEIKPDESEPTPDEAPKDAPRVMTVVAAADPSAVAFAVPVPGAVAISPAAHLATPPPPPTQQAPPRPTQFNPGVADGGSYPQPDYPSVALRNHYQGTAVLEIMVEADGTITSVKVQKSSGFPALDEAAMEVVKKRWRFPQGQARCYLWSCGFKIT